MRQKNSYGVYPKADPAPVTSSAPPVNSLYSSPVNSSAPSAEDVDPELARYLNRTYWEKKQEEARKSPTPSAPAPVPLATEPLPISQPQPVETVAPVPAQVVMAPPPVNIVEVSCTLLCYERWKTNGFSYLFR
eukprot:XP_014042377.1 PREDICTED: hepatocyte growth factor-regulated tyrosine kinase substrate-like [Salmo salar]